MNHGLHLVLALASSSLLSAPTLAQVSMGGEPASFTEAVFLDIATERMPFVDVGLLKLEDSLETDPGPFRFGATLGVDISPETHGTWEQLDLPPRNRSRSKVRIGPQSGGQNMPRKRHTSEEIIHKLREAEIVVARGGTIGEACKKLEITEQTYYRWRREYGGLKVDQAKRLKELERENGRLKRLLADAHLDNAILKEASKGNW